MTDDIILIYTELNEMDETRLFDKHYLNTGLFILFYSSKILNFQVLDTFCIPKYLVIYWIQTNK